MIKEQFKAVLMSTLQFVMMTDRCTWTDKYNFTDVYIYKGFGGDCSLVHGRKRLRVYPG